MDGFWENVSRYPRYLITFTLGIFYALFVWLKPFFQDPVRAVALIGILISGLILMMFTFKAMLGLTPV